MYMYTDWEIESLDRPTSIVIRDTVKEWFVDTFDFCIAIHSSNGIVSSTGGSSFSLLWKYRCLV